MRVSWTPLGREGLSRDQAATREIGVRYDAGTPVDVEFGRERTVSCCDIYGMTDRRFDTTSMVIMMVGCMLIRLLTSDVLIKGLDAL